MRVQLVDASEPLITWQQLWIQSTYHLQVSEQDVTFICHLPLLAGNAQKRRQPLGSGWVGQTGRVSTHVAGAQRVGPCLSA